MLGGGSAAGGLTVAIDPVLIHRHARLFTVVLDQLQQVQHIVGVAGQVVGDRDKSVLVGGLLDVGGLQEYHCGLTGAVGGHHQGRGRTAGLHAVWDIDDVGPVGALPHVVPVEHIVGVLVGVGQALGDEVAVHRVVVIAAVVGQEGVDVLRQRGVGHVGDRLTLHRHLGLYIAEGGGNGIRVCLVLPVDLAVIAVGVCGRQAVIDILPIGDQGFAGIAYEPGGDGDIVVVLGLKGPFLGNLTAVLVGVPLEIHMVGLGRLSHLGLTGRFQQSIISRIHLSIHIDLADHLQGVLGGPTAAGRGRRLRSPPDSGR